MMERWELPKGWEWRRLGDICKTTSGGTPKRNVAGYYGGTIPWLKSGELDDGLILRTEETITEKGLNESNAKIFPKGTLLIALYGATVGKLGILGIDAATNQAICAIFPSYNVENTFLFWFLRAIRQKLLKSSFGGAQPNISQEIIRNLEVPIPYPDDPARSLAEQRRIVARLELLLGETRAMREDIQAMRRDLAQVMESVLAEVFPNPNEEMPKGWDKIRLNDEVIDILSGFSCARKYAVQTGLLHLRPFNIGIHGELDLTQQIYIPEDTISDPTSYHLQSEDILFNNTNSVELVGKSVIVRKPMECAFSNHLTRIRVIDRKRLNPQWLLLALRALWLSGFFAANCNRWIGQAGFAPTKLAELEIPAPPPDEQRRIVAYLEHIAEEIRAMDDVLAQDLRDIEVLEQSILAAAFRGEV